MRSSGWNTAATIPPASPRWKAGSSRAGAPRASCAISKRGSQREPLKGTIGIGHTRWATHGKPTENNAHPHATDRLAVVHNGIIENFRELREELEKKGAKFGSETDTEVVAHLVTQELKNGRSPAEAVAAALPRLRGAFALAFLFDGRGGPPDRRAQGLAARDRLWRRRDVSRLRRHRARAVHRYDLLSRGRRLGRAHAQERRSSRRQGQQGRARGAEVAGFGPPRRQGQLSPLHGEGDPRAAGGRRPHAGALSRHGGRARAAAGRSAVRFPHPRADVDVRLRHRLLRRAGRRNTGSSALRGCRSRSTSHPSSAIARRRCRRAGSPSSSRSRARPPTRWRRCATPRSRSSTSLAVVNVPTSTIARESDAVMPTLAGPEIGVASTKAFTCQLAVLACLAIAAGRARGVLSEEDERNLVHALIEVPRLMTRGAGARAADRAARARSRQEPRRALSRPRHQLSARARRRAQAQGNLLHPCRRLCRRRAQARTDRADRREHAGHRHRARTTACSRRPFPTCRRLRRAAARSS